MHGKANKGLFITTRTFTRSAKEEASREGADLIDLLDGEQVIDKELELGVSVTMVEKVEIDQERFENL